ncbi:unnamed protein product [Tuber aestivum]|uniref:Uncharacterized protein n=1 Tax=Tuber aestivum TaxID=59557 RepID=A0A292Q9K0_9PEZI|nr:unnamed protein product [Tuber aestivum]
MSEQPQASDDVQATALNPILNPIGTHWDAPGGAGGSPSWPIPMPHVGPESQQLQEMDARWSLRFKHLTQWSEAESFLRCQECESRWFQRWDGKKREIQENAAEMAGLIATLLHEKAERMKLEHKFNLYGALGNSHKLHLLELIVCHARLTGKIGWNLLSGIQDGIDELAKTPALVAALRDETVAYQLAPQDVTQCIGCIHHTVSNHNNGNDHVITLYEDDYTREECAVLAAFLEVQRDWPDGFAWKRMKRRQQIRR